LQRLPKDYRTALRPGYRSWHRTSRRHGWGTLGSTSGREETRGLHQGPLGPPRFARYPFSPMTVLAFSLVVGSISLLAGLVGSLTGLGGGVVIVPTLVLGLGVDIRYAIGASLVSVIATSSGAAAAYVEEGYTNLRLGMFLELATTAGALGGAYLAARVPPAAIATIFGLMLLGVVFFAPRGGQVRQSPRSTDPLATWLRLEGVLPPNEGALPYRAARVGLGFGLMVLAGVLSGLLGIGSGAMKVLAMDWAMRIPFKVSTATSNFMIGVTAAASAGYYLSAGYLDPGLTMPVMLGVLAGALIGARLLHRLRTRVLRLLFQAVILVLGVEMIYNGLAGRFLP